ncbi:uncharacterized protein NEMAJ01_2355, partial [Nematocida major]|uniref:uncharacterized protein n=1 Tax=Nematocida major TaxID=1912982 RepID=UPI0020078DD6
MKQDFGTPEKESMPLEGHASSGSSIYATAQPEDSREGGAEKAKNSSGLILEMKNYGLETKKGVSILKGVSLSIPKGKMVAMIGLSGDGKSTLLEGMAGHCNPSHKTYGEIHVEALDGTFGRRDIMEWFSRVNYAEQASINYEAIPLYVILCSI